MYLALTHRELTLSATLQLMALTHSQRRGLSCQVSASAPVCNGFERGTQS
jgi:hypothetical protein